MSNNHDREPGPMSYQHASHLLNPLRRLILSPKQLAKRLDLREDSKVLELGPGPGYFSLEVARSIPAGKLVLADIQQEMLDMARKRLEKRGIANVEYQKGDAASLPLDSESFDVVYLVAVLGELPGRGQCLREIHRLLGPKGLLSITEQPGDPDFMPMAEVKRLAEREGFHFERTYGRGRNYTINFRKLDRADG